MRQEFLEIERRRWADYVAAAKRAHTTCLIEDGIKAGHAWRDWLDIFTALGAPKSGDVTGDNVVQFGRRP